MIIDTHAHFGTKNNQIYEKNRKNPNYKQSKMLEDLDELKFITGEKDTNISNTSNLLENYIEVMEKNNIECAWIHQLSFKEILGYEVLSNQDIYNAISKYPDKLRGFASADPRLGQKTIDELKFAINSMGLSGVKLNPNDYGGFFLNDKMLYPIYSFCSEFNIPLSVHTGITPSSIFRMKHNNPILLDDVAVDFPNLTIIVEHMGMPWNDLCYNMVARHKNMYITITAVANILVKKKPNILIMELAKMISQIGNDRILWGSDWTATPNIYEVIKFIQNLEASAGVKIMTGINDFTQEDKDSILGENAKRIIL